MLNRIFFSYLSFVLIQSLAPIFAAREIPDQNLPPCGKAVVNLVYTPRGSLVQTTLSTVVSFGAAPEGVEVTDPGIEKTYLVSNLGKLIQTALYAVENSSLPIPAPLLGGSVSSGSSITLGVPYIPGVVAPEREESKSREKQIADGLIAQIQIFETRGSADPKILDAFVYVRKLAKLIAEKRDLSGYLEFASVTRGGGSRMMRSFGSAAIVSSSAPKGLRVAAGGAQDWDQFKAKLDGNKLPKFADFDLEGFFRSFSLPLVWGPKFRKDQQVAAKSGILYDRAHGKLFLQLDIDGNITPENFKRPPLNLVVALDISGSMIETDGGEVSRLSAAKAALIQMLDKLSAEDSLSVVLFDNNVETLIDPVIVTRENKAALRKKLADVVTRGTTNIAKALVQSVALADKAKVTTLFGKQGDRETRIVLLTDAGNNTGSSNDEVVRLAGTAAQQGISLTVIGVGQNLEPDFARELSLQKGGNYIFVKDGKGLETLFRRFDLLVTPIGYSLTMNAQIEGLDATLVQAYGANIPAGSTTLSNVMSIPTLFFVDSGQDGGGTLFFEWDVKPK